jgi:hypothetical protein
MLPLTFHFEERDTSEDNDTEPPGHYELRWVNLAKKQRWTILQGWFHFGDEEGDILSPPLPQWPYVLFHCCLVGDLNPKMARVRLEILVDSIRKFPDPHGILEAFKQPFPDKCGFADLQMKLSLWINIMEDVVRDL